MGSSASAVSPAGPHKTADGPDHDRRSADQGGQGMDLAADRSVDTTHRRRAVRSWPLLILAAPAAVAVWSGWVGIGQMTGFGEIHPLPGIWDSLHLNTAVTLPIGVEAYAAFALRAWLTRSQAISERTRRFARQSAIGALLLGMAGQVAYHLLAQANVARAPWEITTVVACLPVLVLGMGSALAHLIRGDSAELSTRLPDCHIGNTYAAGLAFGGQKDSPTNPVQIGGARPPARVRIADVKAAVATVVASGSPVSRRSLRAAGLHGSNADLGMLARRVRGQPRVSR